LALPPSPSDTAYAAIPAAEGRAVGGLPLWVALLALTGHLLRFGYGYGAGDQDELIPSLLHLLDPALFTQDWLVQTVTSGVNVRTFFLWLVALPSLVLPPWLAVALLWGGVFVALGYGVYGLAYELLRDRAAAALGVLVALVVTVKWTLGANSVAYDALVPEGVAWALAVPAITLFLQRRWLGAGALLGAASWFHLLAGAHAALVLGAAGLVRAGLTAEVHGDKLRRDAADLVRFGGAFVLVSLPILVPVVLDQFAAPVPMEATPSPFYIHAVFRNPFHHLASTFGAEAHLRFWPVVALGIAAGGWLRRRERLRHGGTLAIGAVCIALLCAVAVVFVEVVPVTLVAKLQFFKLTVLVTLVASILLSGALVAVLPGALRRFGESLLNRHWSGLAVVLVLLGTVLALGVRGEGRFGALLSPVHHTQTPLGEIEAWAQAETDADALWAVPPSVSTFRTYARRAVVANYSGFVFSDRDMRRWFLRLMDVAPIPPPPTGEGIKPALDAAYHAQSAADWQRLRRSYGAAYALVARDAATLPFEVAVENERWRVYRLPAPEASP
jgi:hypothetical protein